MKRLLFLLIGIITFWSCNDKTKSETELLLVKVFEIGGFSGDSLYFSTNSLVDWLDIAGIDSCTQDEFAVLEDIYHRRRGNKIKLPDIFRKQDFEKICSEGRIDFEFDKGLIPRNFIPKEQGYYDSLYMSFRDAISTSDPSGLRLLEMNKLYYRLSKPIFLQDYRYAVIGFSYQSFLKDYGSCSMLVFEKKGDEWELIFTSQLCPFA